MINNIYVLKNTLARRYNDIMTYPTDEYAKARIKEFAEKSGTLNLTETELYRVGSMDVEEGRLIPLEEPIKINLEIDKKQTATEILEGSK